MKDEGRKFELQRKRARKRTRKAELGIKVMDRMNKKRNKNKYENEKGGIHTRIYHRRKIIRKIRISKKTPIKVQRDRPRKLVS